VANVADDADDLVFAVVVPADLDALADRVLVRPVTSRECFVHDDLVPGLIRPPVVEQPSADDRDSHRREVVVRDHPDIRDRFLAELRLRLADDARFGPLGRQQRLTDALSGAIVEGTWT
jgi:hypothetical protein